MIRTKPIESTGTSDKAEQILQGAMQEFLTHGYAATSMDRVAKVAGVSKATVYSYFKDKEDLFTVLIQRLAGDCLLTPQLVPEEPHIFLPKLAQYHLDRMLNERQLMTFIRLIIGESARFPELAQTFVKNLTKPAIERLSQYIASRPELKHLDSEVTARVFIGGLVHFILTQEILHGKEILPMESDRFIQGLVNMVLSNTIQSSPCS